MATSSSNGDDDDDMDDIMFAYEAPSNASAAGAARRPEKTVYEMERDARVSAILKQQEPSTVPPRHDTSETMKKTRTTATMSMVRMRGRGRGRMRMNALGTETGFSRRHAPYSHSPHFVNSGARGGVRADASHALNESRAPRHTRNGPIEEAQRLREQRYAMYRRNRDLNQNALKEVDPETKRYVQIAYTPAQNGPRQHQGVRQGGGGGTAYGARRFVLRGDRGPKRARE